MTQSRYVFDLDNTLFYTDSLNNESYNYALEYLKLPLFAGNKRITREIIFDQYTDLSNEQKNSLIELKQTFFITNLNQLAVNHSLFELLKQQNPEFCILWTSADKTRVFKTLEYFHIERAFKDFLYSKKNNVEKDVLEISRILQCQPADLAFYEDDKRIIDELYRLKLNVFPVKKLDD